MKLAYISDSIVPSRYANSVQVVKMCDAFARQGHDVALFARCPIINKAEPVDIYSYYGASSSISIRCTKWLSGKAGNVIYGVVTAIKAVLMRPDLVYGRSLVGCYVCAKLGIPVILELHGPIYQTSTVRKYMLSSLIRDNDLKRLVVISEALKRLYANDFRIDQERIVVAHDGADVPVHNDPADDIRCDGQFQVGYIGHLYGGRGIGRIADMAKACPWATFSIVGGHESDIETWKARFSDIQNLRFVGFVPPSQVGEYMKKCDVLLAPYERTVAVGGGGGNTVEWMSPLKIFEYMSSGRPILCSDIPVLKEVLKHEKTAIFCDPESTEEWIMALDRLRNCAKLRTEIGEAAREELTANYTWKARAMKVIPNDLHNEIC